MCVLLIVIPGLLRLASHNPSFFFTPTRDELSSQRGSKRTEKRRKEKQGGMTERKEKGHEGGGRWRKVKKERAREKKRTGGAGGDT